MTNNVAPQTKKSKKLRLILIIFAAVLVVILILCFVFIDNKTIDYEIFNIEKSSTSSVEIKIAHLSDLHFPKIETDTDALIDFLASEYKPDFIALTGDLIDSSAVVSSCGVREFIKKLAAVAPVFYVNGNHEVRHQNASGLYTILADSSVTMLFDDSVNIVIKGKPITIIGVEDNDFEADYSFIKSNPQAEESYKILLAHRPERFDDYTDTAYGNYRANLILSGHAHGGQIRIPFAGGIVAPGQGLFPKFDSGAYFINNTEDCMIVSRGIGNSILPLRFNNKPHVPLVTVTI